MVLLIPTAWAVMTFVFLVVRILPGDPAIAMLGGNASEEALAALREQLGLNLPLWKQYLFFLRDVVNLDFGNSMITGTSVLAMTSRALIYTTDLVLMSMVISILVGYPFGIADGGEKEYLDRLPGQAVSRCWASQSPTFSWASC